MAPRAPRPIPTRPLSSAWFPATCFSVGEPRRRMTFERNKGEARHQDRTCENTSIDVRGWVCIFLSCSKVCLANTQADHAGREEVKSSHCCTLHPGKMWVKGCKALLTIIGAKQAPLVTVIGAGLLVAARYKLHHCTMG